MPSLLWGDEDEHRYIRNLQGWVLGAPAADERSRWSPSRPAPPPPHSCSLGVLPDWHLGIFISVHLFWGGGLLDLRLTGAGAGGVVLQ